MVIAVLIIIWLAAVAGYLYQKELKKMSFEEFKARMVAKGYEVRGDERHAVFHIKIKKEHKCGTDLRA